MLYTEAESMTQRGSPRGHGITLPEVITLFPQFGLENGFAQSIQISFIPLEPDPP